MSISEISPFRETGIHSYHRRAINHDYYAPFIYHIILKKNKECEIFGTLEGDARIAPGNPGCARIRETALGKTISKAIIHLPYEYPIIKLHQHCVMPDHVHILLQVLYRSDKHLDFYIESLRDMIAARYSRLTRQVIKDTDIFEPGYCDKPLYADRSLDGLYRYIRENPHRLAIRRLYPVFFRRIRQLRVGDKEYDAYGNLFLLRNPDKEAARLSRNHTTEEQKKKDRLLSAATKGTILVSPFISPAEKALRAEAEAAGAKIILVTHEAFPERFKPAVRDFELCAEGRLLIISISLPTGTPLTRIHCNVLNELSNEIAATSY